ncbi:hypothetical protein BDV96DRAFT_640489 [Lophiotrema nucula]|uniref:Zn(2)-C6 fungal-type domain-containing protein n=1 Tax=Lophiotrema nucula TaxID=690887 RepID=A0A6A5ZNR5_9PLEO|nr:hypothetical protein BDV96DRAFT_640489 [Lophiotrema nucula]
MAPETRSRAPFTRTRKIHQKSRKGCFECKRRRVKCDEGKPSCMRCVSSLDKCIYPAAPQYAVNDLRVEVRLPSPPCSNPSSSPNAFSQPKVSPLVDQASDYGRNAAADFERWSEPALYEHYLKHTSFTLSHCPQDQEALQIGMPALALQSETVYHSMLAISAACVGCDMIAKHPSPSTNAVTDVLMTGYRHYNSASEKMRDSLSQPDALQKPDPLLASALLLIPFATSSQQINHWISSRSDKQESIRLLSTTPRDVIVIMNGIRMTLQSLEHGSMSPAFGHSPATDFDIEHQLGLLSNALDPQASPARSRNHAMYSIVATTSEKATSRLQSRIESAGFYYNDGPYESLSPCSAAFKILKNIRNSTFATPTPFSATSLAELPRDELETVELVLEPRSSPWVRAFADRCANPQPTGLLTRYFLNFLVRAPQAYLDIVLPLLDKRLEVPGTTTSDNLTQEQALALDIYAHWSVFMFLVEDESWWIGDLPAVTLTGMINRYGDDFVTRLGYEDWWPGSMLKILKETRQYR